MFALLASRLFLVLHRDMVGGANACLDCRTVSESELKVLVSGVCYADGCATARLRTARFEIRWQTGRRAALAGLS